MPSIGTSLLQERSVEILKLLLLMKWLTDFAKMPMIWDVMIPVILLMAFALFLVWDSRLPPEKKMLARFRKKPNSGVIK